MPETGKVEKLTEAEIVAFDQQARENFERDLREKQAEMLKHAWKPQEDDPKPGTPEAAAAIKDAIKQGNE